MASCDELFEKRQRLIKEKAEVDSELSKVKKLQASQLPDDDAIKKEIEGNFADDMEKMEETGEIDDLIEQALDNSKANPEVNIPEGQPSNFSQLLRYDPDYVVANYGVINKSLQNSGQRLMPDKWDFINDDPSGAAQQISETLTGKMTPEDILRMMDRDAGAFNSAVEKTLRVRAFYQVSHKGLLDRFDDIEKFMDNNTKATQVPAELLNKLISTYKVALMSERQYDFVRNTWSKQGRAMQGGGFRDLEIDIVSGKLEDQLDQGMDVPSVEEARQMQPEDFAEDSPIARVLAAADTFRTDRIEGMKQLELEIKNARIVGVDPFKILDPATWEDRMHRLTNTLAKDHQLWNLRTQGLNAGSNLIMSLYGPARKIHEGVAYTPVGTTLKQAYYEQLHAAGKAYGSALNSIRHSGKEVFLDAWNNKSLHYAGQIDTYGKYFKTVDEQIRELERLRDWTPRTESSKRLMRANPAYWRRWSHASTRLWLYEKTGHAYFLRPGLTNLAAVDNVAGFFFHNYNLRHDLEIKARRDGFQLGLMDENGKLDRRAVDDWINNQMKEASYNTQVTEKMRLRYRKETGLTPDIVGDVELENMIREERVAKTYGGPVMDKDLVRDAALFSEEMRFQGRPSDKNIGAGIYKGVDQFRKDAWIADTLFPYLQAPFKGASLDLTLTGMGPLLDTVRIFADRGKKWTPKEVARVKANAAMAATTWSMFWLMESNDLIVGNGPMDPELKRQWKTRMAAEGKKPNSIGGIPMIGGLPVINTLFLMKDFKDSLQLASMSELDARTRWTELFTVLVGHMTRNTALGNLKQLNDLIFGDDYGQRRPGKLGGYYASGQTPFIGPIRQAERFTNAKASQVYRPKAFTKRDEQLFDEYKIEQFENQLRDKIYNFYSLSAFAGGKFKNNDWLGTKIRLVWNENYDRYKDNRHGVGIHPEGEEKVYAELHRLGLLDEPGPLLNRRLDGVPMDDDMQELYNETYHTTKGNSAALKTMKKGMINPAYTFDPQIADYVAGSGLLKGMREKVKFSTGDGDAIRIELAPLLLKHVNNKTPKEAFRSLFKSPFYKKLMELPGTTNDLSIRDQTTKELKTKLPFQLTEAIKNYYEVKTLDSFNVSEHPSALLFREMRKAMEAKIAAEGEEERVDTFKAFEVLQEK